MRISKLPQLVMLWCWAATISYADILNVTLDSVVQTGTPSSLLNFSGTLFNSSGMEIFLNGADANVDYSQLTIDFNSFFSNAPLSLPNDTSYIGPLFSVDIGTIALPGDYFGSFDIQGGSDSYASDIVASGDFEVDVSGAPEPSYTWLLRTILVALVTGRSLTALMKKSA